MRSSARWKIPLFLAAMSVCPTACRRRDPAPVVDPAPAVLPAPSRPSGILAHLHSPSAQSLLESVSALTNQPLAASMVLLSLDIDASVVAALDVRSPLDVYLVADPASTTAPPEVVVALAPVLEGGNFRDLLSPRFRFERTEGLGEKLVLREASGTLSHLSCAIVGVNRNGTPSPRVVCARSVDTLTRVGRWAAQPQISAPNTDALLDVSLEADALHTVLLPRVARWLDDLARSLDASALRARALHPNTPSLGDPETIVSMVHRLSLRLQSIARDQAVPAARDRPALHAAIRLQQGLVHIDTDLAFNSFGAALLDAIAHPVQDPGALAARVLPDSWLMLNARTQPETHRAWLSLIVDAALSVLGDRVAQPALARADLERLFSHAGDTLAFGARWVLSPQGTTENEFVLLMNTQPQALPDGGVALHALSNELTSLSQAPWLKGMQLGNLRVATSMVGQTLLVSTESFALDAGTPTPSRTMALRADDNVLTLVLSRDPLQSLKSMSLRTDVPLPTPFAGTPAAVQLGFDPGGVLGLPTDPSEHVRLALQGTRAPDGALLVHLGIDVPSRALKLLSAILFPAEETNTPAPDDGGVR